MFPGHFILTCILIKLVSSASNDSTRSFNSACGDIYTKQQFILESPNWPKGYAHNTDCSYLLKGPFCPTNYQFQFLDFNLEESTGCVRDRLEIDSQDALCGTKQGVKSYYAKNGALQLRFKTDGANSGRGYRILVTRSTCQVYDPNSETDEIPTTKKPVRLPQPRVKGSENKPQCCLNDYNLKRFLVTSPNFPYSSNTPTDCIIRIQRANANICRLRIHVLFFYLGAPSEVVCSQGFLQIDGKYICGCQSDLKLISAFGQGTIKELRFRSSGLKTNSYTGFVLEVIQDECPKRYSPAIGEELSKNISTKTKEFHFYNDQLNRVAWPNSSQESLVEKLKLIGERTEILDDDEVENDSKPSVIYPKVIKHVYFYAAPNYNQIPFLAPKDREESTYIDTSTVTMVVENHHEYSQCVNWNQIQFNQLNARFGGNLPKCRTNQGTTVNSNCIELDYIQGYFRSPGYPFYYPGNMNVCYRFRKQPGYCFIRVHMQDFQLQSSFNCQDDFVLFGGAYKYCGDRLLNTVSTFDLRQKDYEEVRFVTDAYYCGKGFSGTYEQIACQDMMAYPINPVNPPTSENPRPVPPTTVRPIVPCGMFIQDETFTVDVYSHSAENCVFEIQKSNSLVCKIELYLEKFDLQCAFESLLIDDRMFCGHHTGRRLTLDVGNNINNKLIIYRKVNSYSNNAENLRLRIRGRQIQDDCAYPEVPAERLLHKKVNASHTETALTVSNRSDTRYLVGMVDRNFKDICGVITKTKQQDIPKTFCDIFMRNENTTKCVPLTENALFVPYGAKKIELKIRDAKKLEEVEFEEIDCDNLVK